MLRDGVTLTESEMKMLKWVGERRYENATRNNRNPGNASSNLRSGPHFHIMGARGEFAGSLIVNRYWRLTIGQIDQPDIGGFIDARTIDNPRNTLLIKPRDIAKHPGRPFMLVEWDGEYGFWCPGWYRAGDAAAFALATHTRDRTHVVPRDKLRPIFELREMSIA